MTVQYCIKKRGKESNGEKNQNAYSQQSDTAFVTGFVVDHDGGGSDGPHLLFTAIKDSPRHGGIFTSRHAGVSSCRCRHFAWRCAFGGIDLYRKRKKVILKA